MRQMHALKMNLGRRLRNEYAGEGKRGNKCELSALCVSEYVLAVYHAWVLPIRFVARALARRFAIAFGDQSFNTLESHPFTVFVVFTVERFRHI